MFHVEHYKTGKLNMKSLKFIQDVYDDDMLVFQKGYVYPISFESEDAFMVGHYGISRDLVSDYYIITEEEED